MSGVSVQARDEQRPDGRVATVAVCTRNRGPKIVETVRSILAGDLAGMELLIVDQSDDDSTERALAPFADDARIRYLRTDTRGIYTSRFIAVEAAAGDYVLFTDDDCAVPADWARTLCDLLDAHDDVGMVFCNVVAAPHDPTAGFVPTYVRSGEIVARSAWAKMRARGIGAGMAVRRRDAIEIGNFDRGFESYFTRTVGEEGDLALRMILAGRGVLETDRVAVVHDGFRTWEQGKDLARRNFTGIGAVYGKAVRAGHWSALLVVLYEGIVVALLQPLGRLLRGRRPGLKSFLWFWVGFVRSFRPPLDRSTVTFRATTPAPSL